MKKIFLIVAMIIMFFQATSYPIDGRLFEIRVVDKTGGVIGVEMRETSGGANTPIDTNSIADLVFGIKWLASYGVDLGSSITTNYNIKKSGSRTLDGTTTYHYQSFYADFTPFTFPTNWTQNVWVEIMSIPNNLAGTGTGTFEICENGFDGTLDLNINVDLTDYLPSINGSASGVPLPVELTSFTASAKQNKVNLTWETKTEVNNYGFEVERRIGSGELGDGSWEKIGFVNGSGNSNTAKEYKLTDKNPVGGSKFVYRLKQIDNDGQYAYSKEVQVEIVPTVYELYQNYPNPFNPSTNIKFALPKSAKVNLSVYNLLGEKVATILNEEKEAGYYNVKFDASGYSSGVYIFRLVTEDFVHTKKMNLIK